MTASLYSQVEQLLFPFYFKYGSRQNKNLQKTGELIFAVRLSLKKRQEMKINVRY
jgi:hypothetical protein